VTPNAASTFKRLCELRLQHWVSMALVGGNKPELMKSSECPAGRWLFCGIRSLTGSRGEW
jgi:hypothetical protein